jgi:hypothetical protein
MKRLNTHSHFFNTMSLKEALATHLGWDIADVEYYQPCTWSRKIVTTDDNWYCATRTSKPPRVKSAGGDEINDWVLAEEIGEIKIWKR